MTRLVVGQHSLSLGRHRFARRLPEPPDPRAHHLERRRHQRHFHARPGRRTEQASASRSSSRTGWRIRQHRVARLPGCAADGYTICIINADPMIYNQYLFKNLSFDPDKISPIINLFHLIQVLVINSISQGRRWTSSIAVSKQKPGTLSYLSARSRALFMDSLKQEKGADWVRVPFKGGGEATNAILGGSTPIGLLGLGNVMSQISAAR